MSSGKKYVFVRVSVRGKNRFISNDEVAVNRMGGVLCTCGGDVRTLNLFFDADDRHYAVFGELRSGDLEPLNLIFKVVLHSDGPRWCEPPERIRYGGVRHRYSEFAKTRTTKCYDSDECIGEPVCRINIVAEEPQKAAMKLFLGDDPDAADLETDLETDDDTHKRTRWNFLPDPDAETTDDDAASRSPNPGFSSDLEGPLLPRYKSARR